MEIVETAGMWVFQLICWRKIDYSGNELYIEGVDYRTSVTAVPDALWDTVNALFQAQY